MSAKVPSVPSTRMIGLAVQVATRAGCGSGELLAKDAVYARLYRHQVRGLLAQSDDGNGRDDFARCA
jgi:hypothetical protein